MEYPDEEILKLIETWNIAKSGVMPLVNFIVDIWHWNDYVVLDGDNLELHTGGWSGNEDIINSLEKNWLFWSLTWVKSEKGGHHYFKIGNEAD
jgi:hypothetical protein